MERRKMDSVFLIDSATFKWVVIPFLIFLARIIDVSLGTMRIIYISRGLRFIAPIFGFFEVLIWLLAISQIMKNLTNIIYYIAYCAGFATGNFVGIFIEDLLAIGKVVLRIIVQKDASELAAFLRSEGYGVTSVNAEGVTGNVKIIFSVIDRKNLESVIGHVKKFNPKAFFSVEDVRLAREGIFPPSRHPVEFFKQWRKGK
jgi:uncharacterized protein YebE (UPF0316 family)